MNHRPHNTMMTTQQSLRGARVRVAVVPAQSPTLPLGQVLITTAKTFADCSWYGDSGG